MGDGQGHPKMKKVYSYSIIDMGNYFSFLAQKNVRLQKMADLR